MALEGFDLVVIGVVIPSLLDDTSWNLTASSAGLISSLGLVGVMVGALVVGPLTDRFGRRRMMIGTVVAFSLLTLACAFATGPVSFGALPFAAGILLRGPSTAATSAIRFLPVAPGSWWCMVHLLDCGFHR